MDLLQQLRQQQAKLMGDARAMLNAADGESRGMTAEEETKYNGLIDQINALDTRINQELELQAREAAAAAPASQAERPGTPAINRIPLGDSEARAAAHYVRTGDMGGLRELRASNDTGMNITTAADGLNAVPTGHFREIIARRDEFMLAQRLGVRTIAGVGTTVNVPIDNEADGEFVLTGEMGDDNATNVFDRDAPALDVVAMTLVKYTKKIELTDELLEDEDSNLLAFIADFVGRGMAKTHNSLMMTAALAGGTAALTFDAAATIGATEVPELYYKLADEYTEGGTVAWVMRRATEGIVRGLTGNPFLYEPTPNGNGMQRVLWGSPIANSAYVGAATASGKSMVLGNWYYMGLREAPGLTFLRDPYTVDGKVILKYYFRAVYAVLQAEAIVYGTHPTG